jgi:hypothetical protein
MVAKNRAQMFRKIAGLTMPMGFMLRRNKPPEATIPAQSPPDCRARSLIVQLRYGIFGATDPNLLAYVQQSRKLKRKVKP